MLAALDQAASGWTRRTSASASCAFTMSLKGKVGLASASIPIFIQNSAWALIDRHMTALALCPSQLFTWRREARKAMEATAPVFVPAVIEPASVTAVPERSVRRRSRQARADGMVELEIDGVAVKIGRGADASVIAAVVDALKVSR